MPNIPFFRLAAAVGGAVLVGAVALGIAGAAGGGNVAGDVLQTLRVGGSVDQSGPSSQDAPGDDAATRTPERTPVSEVAANNPDGHCVMLPSVSDIIEHPEKHPQWHILGGECPTETPREANGTATPTPTGRAGHEGVEPTEAEPTEACPNPHASDPGKGAANANPDHSAFVKNCG